MQCGRELQRGIAGVLDLQPLLQPVWAHRNLRQERETRTNVRVPMPCLAKLHVAK